MFPNKKGVKKSANVNFTKCEGDFEGSEKRDDKSGRKNTDAVVLSISMGKSMLQAKPDRKKQGASDSREETV